MNLSIAHLLRISAVALIVVALGLSLWMSSQVNQLDVLGHKLEHLSAAREGAQELRYHSAQIQQFYTDSSLTGDRAAADEAHQHYQEALDKLTELKTLTPEFDRELEAMRRPLEQLDSAGLSMFKAYSSDGKDAGNKIMSDFDSRSSTVISDFAALQAPLNKSFEQAQSGSEDLRESLKSNTLLAWGIALTVMLGTLWLIHVRVLPPLRRMSTSLQALNTGHGDLSQAIPQDGNDEISAVVVEFNAFVAGLRSKISTVANVGKALDNSAGQLVRDAEAAELSAEHLRIEVEQIATAVNQMAATVQGVASNAQASSSETGDANREAQAAIQVVDKTIADIRALAEEVGKAADVIQTLESHSREIGGVLEVIRTIAEQTNLLALNAAIEAARAGEQGRGFAVVADEVRTLASRTQASTQEIHNMIERLQNTSQQAVKVMHESRGYAENGVTQAEGAGQALVSICTRVASVSNMSLQIAAAAHEQSDVSDELSRRITSVADVAGRTVKLAENTLARGRAAGEDAQQLAAIVSQFKF